MLSMLLFALGVALALFFATNFLCGRFIQHKYMSSERRAERIAEYQADLQRYVTERGLSCDDTKEISRWAQGHRYLYVLIYKDDKLLFESGRYEEENKPETGENKENADDEPDNSVENGDDPTGDVTDPEEGTDTDEGTLPDGGTDPGEDDTDVTPDGDGDDTGSANTDESGEESADGQDKEEGTEQGKDENKYPSSGITVKTPTRDELIAEAVAGGSYPIVASDGVLLASMVDYTEYLYYDLTNILAIVLGFIGFLLVMWIYFFELTRRITRLGKEVTAVADGDMTRTITAEGEDEITRLCTDVEYMRSSMLENIEKERAALEANRELITAMSHDIRTPLTVLLGYIDIMKLNTPEGDMQQYIEASERTALRLKKMSDDMFSYFLVYGGGIEVSVLECDARTLVDQMLSGHVFLLREQGYTIDFNFEHEDNDFLSDVTVVTDPPQLMRIVDNIFSNVMKYADREHPVSVFVGAAVDEMTIKVTNRVRPNPDEAQKNGIGLRSCMKLASAMDVRFSSEEEDGTYSSVMFVPIIPHIEYGDTDGEEERRGFIKWLRSVFEKLKSSLKRAWQWVKKTFLALLSRVKALCLKLVRLIKKK
jgi:signal transduction histidine kinase